MLLGHGSVIPAVVEDLHRIVFTKYTGFPHTNETLGSQLMSLMPKPGIPGSRQYLLKGHGYLGPWMENWSAFTPPSNWTVLLQEMEVGERLGLDECR